MVKHRAWWLPLAACLLLAAASMRGAEYDEQYTLFLTAGTPRPAWPDTIFPAGDIRLAQRGAAGPLSILHDLRATDVHPPLFFWLLAAWRHIFGRSLIVARLFSVLCGCISIVLVSRIAKQNDIAQLAAVTLTLGCYGFIYTNAIARNFALAQFLTLAGTWLIPRRTHPMLSGLLFGAACSANYLAAFPAAALILTCRAWPAIFGMLPGLLLDAWCFLAQHGSRDGQFPPFTLLPSIARVVEYWAAGMFGGLPLYWTGIGRFIVTVLTGLIGLTATLSARISRGPIPLLAAATAPALGLLLLGALFDSTPLELRYLSFGLPYCALLLARRGITPTVGVALAVQTCGIIGLLVAPQTEQPARMAARQAAMLAPNAIVLLPYGNDGVGIVGAFGTEADPATPVLLIRASDTPESLVVRIGSAQRAALALMAQDNDSVAAIPRARGVLLANGWHLTRAASKIEVFERSIDRQTPDRSD